MRRIGRFIFNGTVALSAVLFMAVGVMWVRSHWATDHVNLQVSNGVLGVGTPVGKVGFVHVGSAAVPYLYASAKRVEFGSGPPEDWDLPRSYGRAHWLGFAWFGFERTSVVRGAAAPCWAVMLVTAVMPGWWLARWRNSWRERREGCCAMCGYDLRATPERCPECGAVPGEAKAARRVKLTPHP